MPRHFDEPERRAIQAALIKTGTELFGRKGLEKVSVDELCRSARIAKGSFYAFFPSKEALFLAAVKETEARIRVKAMEIVRDESLSPAEQFKRLYTDQLKAMESIPIVRVAMQPETLAVLTRRLPPEAFVDRGDEELLAALLSAWRARGVKCRYTVKQLLKVFYALVYIYMHKDEPLVSGVDAFQILWGLLVESLFKGAPHGK
ncbi:MAG: TetR/AcrR family transcriptional regulator [Spirochaetia bacterium]|jgi:AcrR family transcriptional regulator